MDLGWKSITALPNNTRFGWTDEARDIDGLDPYVAWADGTAFKGFGEVPPREGGRFPFLVEIEVVSTAAALSVASIQVGGLFETLNALGLGLAGAYRQSFSGQNRATLTLLVQKEHVLKLKSLDFTHDGVDYSWRIRATLNLSRMPQVEPRIQAIDDAIPGLTIAVIDDGCPFAHEKFRLQAHAQQWKSRVRFLWDQGQDPQVGDPWWTLPRNFGYGRELAGATIDELIAHHTSLVVPGEVDEEGCYATINYRAVQRRATHGSVVTDIAAGAPSPLASHGQAPDAAAQASIIFVQLPRIAVADVSGGALHAFVLDALHYIDDRTTVAGIKQPVAINLSYGAMAGPHDGTSILESAIDQFLAGRPDCAVMVAAGNAFETKCHARLRVDDGHAQALQWSVATDDATDSFVEIWLPDLDETGHEPTVSVRLLPPGAAPGTGVKVMGGQARFGVPVGSASPDPVCAVINARSVPNGTRGRMILVAVGPTLADESDRPAAPPGDWTIEICNDGGAPVKIHAWIERDDPSFGGSGKQSRFGDESTGDISRDNTLGSFCHGENTIVVGACIDDQDEHQPVANYSGAGPGRAGLGRDGPDLIAGSEESTTLPGLRAAGTRSGDTVRLSGTSVAAAVVTRRIANTVLRNPPGQSCTQIKQALAVDLIRDPMMEGPERVGRGRLKSLG